MKCCSSIASLAGNLGAAKVSSIPLVTWISLGIGILSFILAATSLIVLIYQFKQSGGRIEAL
jgi:hypothetical protein